MAKSKSNDDPNRVELSADPADYLTGPTSGNSRQGGTTRDGAVGIAPGTVREGDAVETVQANTEAAQTEGNADTQAQAQ